MNLKALLTGDAVRLRYVQRWGTIRVLKPDSTAEHSFYVALYALVVGEWVCTRMTPETPDKPLVLRPNMGELLGRAVLHDLEEARTGDFPRSFKHGNPILKDCLRTAATDAISEVLRPLGEHALRDRLWGLWNAEKGQDTEGRILDFADFLAVLSFLLQERTTWNTHLDEHRSSMMEYFQRFNAVQFDFLRPLVDQASDLLGTLWRAEQ
jgi:5'-deoxynucleotidase YfbR-like HD superfamily hydrolase